MYIKSLTIINEFLAEFQIQLREHRPLRTLCAVAIYHKILFSLNVGAMLLTCIKP